MSVQMPIVGAVVLNDGEVAYVTSAWAKFVWMKPAGGTSGETKGKV